ncbi:MAG TPA: type II CRISPR-associated endonuclease Cas1 [Spirochaetota bacterium]|nr:type II CRISPR-associated endonuclease Cas1 [Spirochaetota bacterium]HOS33396.1 type II CRISPR-associated endonuclease Cas1 [Spirochaetota bacterium]HOS56610.1 type II CRISPR-associated endonuclease Cas1 [Spirochaetota bacterium]HPK62031.1 type II CRISPR-associated endonuclease Cas1 [Spirochaetota bacterium]HQF78923.1 type II CRISPR-associated endonuclease Cas1 [Spirochaetota bacterium]
MLKKTIFFSTPCYLHIKNSQLVYKPHTDEKPETTFPVEDIGFVVIDNRQISVSMSVLELLIENNVAVVFCDSAHNPKSLLLNLDGNHIQSEIFSNQINASEPLKKKLWKQTVEAKIDNQIRLLKKLNKDYIKLYEYKNSVKSGDADNREAVAARVYWKRLFSDIEFKRDVGGEFPNCALNYGYAVVRSAVARSLTGSGLLPTLGIHHCNRYNAFCLADDIMEPFRPFVDEAVYNISVERPDATELTSDMKKKLLEILTVDAEYPNVKRPFMVGLSQTTASLARCFSGEDKKIIYPTLE